MWECISRGKETCEHNNSTEEIPKEKTRITEQTKKQIDYFSFEHDFFPKEWVQVACLWDACAMEWIWFSYLIGVLVSAWVITIAVSNNKRKNYKDFVIKNNKWFWVKKDGTKIPATNKETKKAKNIMQMWKHNVKKGSTDEEVQRQRDKWKNKCGRPKGNKIRRMNTPRQNEEVCRRANWWKRNKNKNGNPWRNQRRKKRRR